MKTDQKKLILEQLKQMPIIQVACQKSGVSRPSYYRWRSEDKEFKKSADEAILEGETMITEMSESQLIALIRDKNFASIQLWLKAHHPRYGNKVEINGNLKIEEQLTQEQEDLIRQALKLAGLDGDPSVQDGNGSKSAESN